jgi:acetyl esterase/lipase
MVFIHGGGWISSDKSQYTVHLNELKKRNASYAYVNINYRLVKDGRNRFPAAENDIKAAMEYVWARVDSFHISPATAIVGASAGAHLTALEAYKYNQKGYIRSIVCYSGVYDMKSFYDEGCAGVPALMTALTGGTPGEKPDLYYASSPINFVAGNNPPTLLIHGTEDTLARYGQAVKLDSLLRKNEVTVQLYSYKGGHNIPDQANNEAADMMFSFMAKYTK